MSEPNWNEGMVENVGDAEDTGEQLELNALRVELFKIKLTGASERVMDVVPGKENEDEDECNNPLLGLGAEEAPKAKLAGADDVEVPEETVLPNDLNGCLSSKMDPCPRLAEGLLQQDQKIK